MARTRERGRKWMVWVSVVIGLVVLVAAAPFVVGRFLPEDYHGRVSVLLAAPPDAVWRALCDHRAAPVSGKMWKGTEDIASENGLPAWIEDIGQSKVTVRTLEWSEGSRIVRALADSVVPMTARTELTLVPEGGGTRLTGTNHIALKSGTWHVPIFRFLLTVTGGANRSLREYFAAIEAAAQ